MDDLEQQIKAWADTTMAGVEQVDEGVSSVESPLVTLDPAGSPRWGRRLAAVAAAAVVVLGAIGVSLAARSDDEPVRSVHTSDPPATSSTTEPQTSMPVVPTDVAFDVLAVTSDPASEVGSLAAAQTSEELAALWAEARVPDTIEGQMPDVDFDERVVVSMTVAGCLPTVSSVRRDGGMVRARVADDPEQCGGDVAPKSLLVALDWATTGDDYLFLLAGDRPDEDAASLNVTRHGTRSDDEEDAGRVPAPGVSASLELDATTVAVGGTITGTVTVVNDSGAPIDGSSCGDYFVATIRNDQYDQGVARLACLSPITIPEGTSTYPVSVTAAVTSCTPVEIEGTGVGLRCNPDGSMPAFPSGEYQLRIDDPMHLVPAIDPVTITVTPA